MTQFSTARYGTFAQAFHWLTAILVVAAFALGPEGGEQRIYSSDGDLARRLHETLGLAVLALTALRLFWRLADTRPEPPAVARWMGLAAKAVQGMLYFLLFAVPLTAVFGAWLEGHPVTLLAGVNIGSPVGLSHDAGEIAAEVHEWLGEAILWVAGVHAVAALFHHYILKDGVLVSMLPRWVPLRERGKVSDTLPSDTPPSIRKGR